MAQLAVVGEQQQALGVGVQPPDVEQPRPRRPGEVLLDDAALDDEVADARAAPVVGHRGEDAARLVQGQVHEVVLQHDAGAVDVHDGGLRVDTAAHLAHDLAVDAHAPGRDQLLGGTPGRDACLGQYLLQAHAGRPLAVGHVIHLG